mgnify:CR=1 FL=1
MSEGSSAPEQIKISKNPQTQQRVEERARELGNLKRFQGAPVQDLFSRARSQIAQEIWRHRIRGRLTRRIEKAEENSTTDELTGLPNRRFFSQELQNRIRERQRTGRDFYVLFMDIDGFKIYNTQYTHAGGDKIIKVFKKVNENTRPREGVIRLAGDEFVQFVDSEITEEELTEVAQRNQKVFTEEAERVLVGMSALPNIEQGQARKSGSISIGLVKYQDGMTNDPLIELSSNALLKAKGTASGIVLTENGQDYRELAKVPVEV